MASNSRYFSGLPANLTNSRFAAARYRPSSSVGSSTSASTAVGLLDGKAKANPWQDLKHMDGGASRLGIGSDRAVRSARTQRDYWGERKRLRYTTHSKRRRDDDGERWVSWSSCTRFRLPEDDAILSPSSATQGDRAPRMETHEIEIKPGSTLFHTNNEAIRQFPGRPPNSTSHRRLSFASGRVETLESGRQRPASAAIGVGGSG
jgi:hypothetical protein